ncbi:PfkB family carbohydrate kinase [Methanobacterium sp.]|uniref:PfkB family carbohydrate kinase n=1 Tax=Methanobacterium sp. TaxID=2164 RepID=UPI003C73156E
MSNITLIGPITKDIIIKNNSTYNSIGGAVYYQSRVMEHLKINTKAIITLSKSDEQLLKAFPNNIKLFPIFTDETIKFQNIYPDNNPNNRIQKAHIPSNPIEVKNIASIDLKDCDALLLGPLCPYDIPLETIEYLSKLKIPIYLGLQGYLRHLKGDEIVLRPWNAFKKFLKFVKILFMDENESATILGKQLPLNEVAKILASFGPEEVIITQGSNGSTIYSKKLDKTYKIPAFSPKKIEDPTGLGDTYMAAYAARKLEIEDPRMCGMFASAASVIKLENKGAFNGNIKLIHERCKNYSKNRISAH